MSDIPIFVDPDDQPVSAGELRQVAESILAKGEPGDANHLAALVVAWLNWEPPGLDPTGPDSEEGR